jgi:hypothetical protein
MFKTGCYIVLNKKMSTIFNNNKISVFCKSCTVVKAKCHLKKKCKFAHTLKEITPDICKYGDECVWRNLTCNKIHEGETKEDYAVRVGFTGKGKTVKKDVGIMAYTRMIVKKLSNSPRIEPEKNKGAMIMEKWGWERGKGLGVNLDGIIEPILPMAPPKTMVNENIHVKGSSKHIKFVKASQPKLEQTFTKLTINI